MIVVRIILAGAAIAAGTVIGSTAVASLANAQTPTPSQSSGGDTSDDATADGTERICDKDGDGVPDDAAAATSTTAA